MPEKPKEKPRPIEAQDCGTCGTSTVEAVCPECGEQIKR